MRPKSEPTSLRRCLRDAHDRPVPYINIWSAEMPETTWRLAHDVDLNMPGIAVPAGLRGVGTPDFTHQAPDRQRRCMLRGCCQVCSGRGEWVVVSNRISTKTITYQGAKRLVLIEPWLCRPCADYAIGVCPGLIGRSRQDDLILCRPTNYALGYSQGWMEGPLEAESQRVMPAMWGELHLHAAVSASGERLRFALADEVSA